MHLLPVNDAFAAYPSGMSSTCCQSSPNENKELYMKTMYIQVKVQSSSVQKRHGDSTFISWFNYCPMT